MKFELSVKEIKTLKKWKEAIKTIYNEYGNFEYRFRPTGIGVAISVFSDLTNTAINITDVDSW